MKKTIWMVVFIPVLTFAQNSKYKNIDSLQGLVKSEKVDSSLSNLYTQISYNYIYQNADSGIEYAKKGLAIAQKIKWEKGIGNAYLEMGRHLISKGDYDSSLYIFNLAIQKFNGLHDNFSIGRIYNQLGILKGNKGSYPEALEYFFKSLAIFENSNNPNKKTNLAGAYENIGTIYNFTDNYDKAIIYLERCIAVLKQIKNRESQIALNYTNIGTVYDKQKNTTKANESFEKALAILVDQKDYFAIAFLNSSWATSYLNNKNYALSIEKNAIALSAANISGDKELITSIIQNLGYAQFKNGTINNDLTLCSKGFKNMLKARDLYKALGNQEGLRKTYLHLSEYYSTNNDFKNAFLMHQLFTAYNDSIYNVKNKQSLQNLEDQRTIELNKKEIELNKLSLANKEKEKWFYMATLLFLTCIGALLFYQSNKRKKTNIQLQLLNENLDEANKTKARFFSIINHDLRSPVANLIQFLHLQKDSPQLLDDESKERLQLKTIVGAENLLTSMEDILMWSKGQMNNFKPTLKQINIIELFADVQQHFESFQKIEIQFSPINETIFTDENYVKTIMRNFTGNAIKALEFTENAAIHWKAYKQQNKIFLSITDNGPGATSEELKALYNDKEVTGLKTGLGLHLIKDLANAIQVAIEIESNKEAGITFVLAFNS